MGTDRENGKRNNVKYLDPIKLANYLMLARDNHDWGIAAPTEVEP